MRSGAQRLLSSFVNILVLLALLLVPTGAFRFPKMTFESGAAAPVDSNGASLLSIPPRQF